ncbi:hypothetical protein F511_15156 [Dorcoceras hygrometricum]|uniref:Uncharacterized protein n=1 Tax=Dorcoceras hygrometricum TaxID=472368 RepID=A0A2Z7DJS6_9LAMI|nr:hypothetical protein F511_15156 [Dorcoceras hygrometricum]
MASRQLTQTTSFRIRNSYYQQLGIQSQEQSNAYHFSLCWYQSQHRNAALQLTTKRRRSTDVIIQSQHLAKYQSQATMLHQSQDTKHNQPQATVTLTSVDSYRSKPADTLTSLTPQNDIKDVKKYAAICLWNFGAESPTSPRLLHGKDPLEDLITTASAATRSDIPAPAHTWALNQLAHQLPPSVQTCD